MPGFEIYILARPIHSGKTTFLTEWIKGKDAGGILSPDLNGVRHFKNISTGEIFPMTASENETLVYSIGKYNFSRAAFDRAEQIISDSTGKEWLVIDEIGPLELNGQGFDPVLKKILLSAFKGKVLLVVRDFLLEEVIRHYKITTYLNPETGESIG